MAHIRILRHYIHTPFLLTALLESGVLVVAAYLGYLTRFGEMPSFYDHLPFAIVFALVVLFFMVAMGVYEARLREGYVGVMLRTAVSIFLLSTLAMAVIIFFAKNLSQARGVLLFASVEAFILIALLRWLTSNLLGEDFLKARVLILGAGNRAVKIASRMRRRPDQRSFILVGFLKQEGTDDIVSEYGVRVYSYPNDALLQFCNEQAVDEIIVAADDRRAGNSNVPIPFEDLMECRLSGIDVHEVQNFIEREACKIDVDLLQRSWLVYSDGFVTSWHRTLTKRIFDLVTATALIVLFSPVLALAAAAVFIGDRFKGPILYRQDRVGLNGKVISVAKFRTMRVDSEESGAVWTVQRDPRITRVGKVLRLTHMDELPQLFSVFKGDMSMVGPRPERPVFVEHLSEQIPYYAHRLRIKPGITGWAQLCYPYGASVEDAKEKLQYDLYYLKNQSILLDMVILLQTVEMVLVGKGAR